MYKYEDPYFNDIPWEIIHDDEGKVIGVIYRLIPKRRFGIDGKRAKKNTYARSGN